MILPTLTSRTVDTLDLFAALAAQRISIPYPLAEATQIGEEAVAARRTELVGPDQAWLGSLVDLVDACRACLRSVDLRYVVGGSELGGVALLDGSETAWVLTVDGARCRIRRVAGEFAVTTLLELLPNVPPVAAAALRLPLEVLRQLGRGGHLSDVERERLARAAGSNLPTVTKFLVAAGAPIGVGQIGVIIGNGGRASRASSTLTVSDGKGGRIIRSTSVDRSGIEWVTLKPAGPHQLQRAVAALLSRALQL